MNRIESLFAKLAVVYGSEWVRKWEGVDMTLVKGDWDGVLANLTTDQIVYGLSKLPERPPNAIQFRELCRHAPVYFEAAQIGYRPTVNPQKRAALLAMLEKMGSKRS